MQPALGQTRTSTKFCSFQKILTRYQFSEVFNLKQQLKFGKKLKKLKEVLFCKQTKYVLIHLNVWGKKLKVNEMRD